MKKIMTLVILAVLLASFVVQPVSAKAPVVKGEVTAIELNAITVLTRRGVSVVIVPPADFDLSSIKIGDTIIAKGTFQEDGSLLADRIVKTGKGADDEDEGEGGKVVNAAYCSADKKQAPHPLATKLAEKYAVSTGWVMEYYCNGYSMGAIMLALKTGQVTGENADDLLALRAAGKGWGAIWQDLHLIGHEKDVNPPPGALKKPVKPGH